MPDKVAGYNDRFGDDGGQAPGRALRRALQRRPQSLIPDGSHAALDRRAASGSLGTGSFGGPCLRSWVSIVPEQNRVPGAQPDQARIRQGPWELQGSACLTSSARAPGACDMVCVAWDVPMHLTIVRQTPNCAWPARPPPPLFACMPTRRPSWQRMAAGRPIVRAAAKTPTTTATAGHAAREPHCALGRTNPSGFFSGPGGEEAGDCNGPVGSMAPAQKASVGVRIRHAGERWWWWWHGRWAKRRKTQRWRCGWEEHGGVGGCLSCHQMQQVCSA